MHLDTFWIILSTVLFCVFLCYQKIFKKTNENTISLDFLTIFLFSLSGAYKIIYFYTLNITKIPFQFGISFILLYVLIFFCLFLFFRIIYKNDNTAIVLSLIGIFALNINILYLEKFYICVGIASLAGILVLAFLNTRKTILILKPFCAALLILCLIKGLSNLFLYNFSEKQVITPAADFASAKLPDRDIYIFLLDAYAGGRTIKHLGADNSEFTKDLQKRGFQVYENMESNYNKTIISISSFLNMDYVENLPYNTPSDAVNNAGLFKMAKQAGYKICYLNSWPMDLHIKEGIIDEVFVSDRGLHADIVDLFLGKTLVFHILDQNNNDKARKIAKVFKYIDKTIKKDEKKFVFVHLLMPHPPYIFDENGNVNSGWNMYNIDTPDGRVLNTEFYIKYLKFTNKKTLEFVDKIFSKSGKKPVIIIMGDHGTRTAEYPGKGKYKKEIETECKYYFNTFLAFYNPDLQPELYKNTGSLVNFYRNFSNDIFGTKLKSLQDKHFYVFEPVTTIQELKGFKAIY